MAQGQHQTGNHSRLETDVYFIVRGYFTCIQPTRIDICNIQHFPSQCRDEIQRPEYNTSQFCLDVKRNTCSSKTEIISNMDFQPYHAKYYRRIQVNKSNIHRSFASFWDDLLFKFNLRSNCKNFKKTQSVVLQLMH